MRNGAPQRIEVYKTYKLFVGGKFIRSESGRSILVRSTEGEPLANVPRGSRKDLRDAVVAAARGQADWVRMSPYLRGQILYRAAEMLESRSSALAGEISRSTDESRARAEKEVRGCVDALVYFAGWADKYTQVLGTVNPVSSPHFNFTIPEAVGVVLILAPDLPALLPMVTLLAACIVAGNSAVVIPSESSPLPALAMAEVLATSDLPGGVANILAGPRKELAPPAASHMDVQAIVDATSDPRINELNQKGTASNLKRCVLRDLRPDAWTAGAGENPFWILDTTELKTTWHPIGV